MIWSLFNHVATRANSCRICIYLSYIILWFHGLLFRMHKYYIIVLHDANASLSDWKDRIVVVKKVSMCNLNVCLSFSNFLCEASSGSLRIVDACSVSIERKKFTLVLLEITFVCYRYTLVLFVAHVFKKGTCQVGYHFLLFYDEKALRLFTTCWACVRPRRFCPPGCFRPNKFATFLGFFIEHVAIELGAANRMSFMVIVLRRIT